MVFLPSAPLDAFDLALLAACLVIAVCSRLVTFVAEDVQVERRHLPATYSGRSAKGFHVLVPQWSPPLEYLVKGRWQGVAEVLN
ncbi:hypothetical protein J2W17_003239 [Pseudomonas lini]|uniref:hypothetical protein n=1 Tax=Pseudomonas lini TaxID=163011 RepID=UPI002787166A|nr:hypothetical protein [Pseudomonas lini]MDQ0124291.1 hypothetical protein [Pseudomonas lini]